MVLLLPLMKPLAPLTAMATEAGPPNVTGKVAPFVDVSVKDSVVEVTVKFTKAALDPLPLVPVTVID